MAAKSRVGLALYATALLWGAVPARAQDTQDAAQVNQGGTTTVGPSELENFNLPGTVTRPAEQPTPAPRQTQTAPPPAARQPIPPAASTRAPPAERPGRAAERPDTSADRETRSAVSAQLPPLSDSPTVAPSVAAPLDDQAPVLPASPPPADVPWPWLLAALAVLGGAGAYWWLGRARAATAGGPSVDAFSAPPPEPASAPGAPAPVPTAAPPAPAPPPLADDDNPIGIVSTRLRPWLEVDLKPLRCVVEKDHVAIDVELTLFNSGSLPARSILLEAAMLNAGPNQDHDIEYFFSNPLGAGKRASSLPPLKKAVVRSRVITPLKDAVEYEVEGRKVYVPLVAVNAIYSWPSGEGQTASAYLVGRETHRDKLAPFRLDRGEGAYEPVDRRQLPNGTRV